MTTSRMVVVLRGELGRQKSLAQIELRKVIDNKFKTNVYGEWTEPQRKEYITHERKLRRLSDAIDSLGSLQLGDIAKTKNFNLKKHPIQFSENLAGLYVSLIVHQASASTH